MKREESKELFDDDLVVRGRIEHSSLVPPSSHEDDARFAQLIN
jgi:hypothetical protein